MLSVVVLVKEIRILVASPVVPVPSAEVVPGLGASRVVPQLVLEQEQGLSYSSRERMDPK